MIFQGHNLGYDWIEWQDRSLHLDDLLRKFPRLVLGKYLLNTTFDSGPLKLSKEEVEDGWQSFGDYSLSPSIKTIDQIPFCHYSEWYSFDSDYKFEDDEYKIFINFGGFSLQHEFYAEQAAEFWKQIELIKAESYLAEGDNLICVTKRSDLYAKLPGYQKMRRGN